VYSLIIPVYRSEASLHELLEAVQALDHRLDHRLQAVFVIDDSPDRCYEMLVQRLPECPFRSRLLLLSRNFGSFAAIRAGLANADGPYFAVMAADLQEPADLMLSFFRTLAADAADVVVGVREDRADPLLTRLTSGAFWYLYRKLVQRELPPGGIDVFGCSVGFRDHLLQLMESRTSLMGLVLWLGFRRQAISYRRLPRRHGRSAWGLALKVRYMLDSLFAFTDLPLQLMMLFGGLGLVVTAVLTVVILIARWSGLIPVPGYTATLVVILFFAALNLLGLSIVGSYAWRAYENTKGRPPYLVAAKLDFHASPSRCRGSAS